MPQRFLRPGITNSERWNSVDSLCQSFYIRILTRVDDYGRCDGRASVLLGECWSVWNERHPEEQIDLSAVRRMLQQLAAECLIDVYEAAGKTVLQITQWQERIREGTKEKWPANTNSAAIRSNPQQVAAPLRLTPSPPPSPPPVPTKKTLKAKKLSKLTPNQKELADRFELALDGGWVNDSGKWVNRIKNDFRKCERVVAEVESAIREDRINSIPAAYAEDQWKQFK